MNATDPIESVELWSGPLPYVGAVAEHHWLTVASGDEVDRWEVWQFADVKAPSWGHLHHNLMAPQAWNHGDATRHHRWTGELANELGERIQSAPECYPWTASYRLLPGPNSNTFVQWALGHHFKLGWKAWGKFHATFAPKGAENFRFA